MDLSEPPMDRLYGRHRTQLNIGVFLGSGRIASDGRSQLSTSILRKAPANPPELEPSVTECLPNYSHNLQPCIETVVERSLMKSSLLRPLCLPLFSLAGESPVDAVRFGFSVNASGLKYRDDLQKAIDKGGAIVASRQGV